MHAARQTGIFACENNPGIVKCDVTFPGLTAAVGLAALIRKLGFEGLFRTQCGSIRPEVQPCSDRLGLPR